MKRIPFAIAVVVVIAGAFFVMRSRVSQPPEYADDVGRATPAPAAAIIPDWATNGPREASFRDSLLPVPDDQAFMVQTATMLLREIVDSIDSVAVVGRLVQVSADGSETRAALRTHMWIDGGAGRVVVDARPAEGEAVTMSAPFAAGVIGDIQLSTSASGQTPDSPLTLGDLPIQELIAFQHAATNDEVTPAGSDRTGRVVLAAPLRLRERLPNEELDSLQLDYFQKVDTRGASALLWVDTKALALDRVYVFNANDVLVREYRDFIEQPPGAAFTVFARPTQSRTTIYLSDWNVWSE